jgi:amino acid adenylation domain-containing protein
MVKSSANCEAYVSHKLQFRTEHYDWSMGHLCLAHSDVNPDQLAVSDGKMNLTYRQLRRYATSLAYSLRRQGVRRGDRVMIFASKNCHSVAAILGVLLSGASYVPVDENVPIERLRFIQESSGAKFALSTVDLPQTVKSIVENLISVPDFDQFDLPMELFQRLPRINPDDEAYVLFTSGSTGTPKGVRISHRGISTFFRNVSSLMATKTGLSRYLNTSPFHYDVSMIDTFFPLYSGASVHISPNIPFPGYVLKVIEKYAITHLCGVGSTLNVLAKSSEFEKCSLSSLERIMTGAEILNPATLKKFLDAAPKLGIINGYGPTEVSCGCIGFLVTHDYDFNRVDIPIGKVMGNTLLKVMDDGELLIGGDQVMLGYVDCDVSRLSKIDGCQYFHSGDIVSTNEDGDYVFRGRKDGGVKIRGHRVHLEELENMFLRFAGVEGAVSAVIGDGEAMRLRLMLAGDVAVLDIDELVLQARDHLPKHMIPERVAVKERFPLLASGKIDRKALETELRAL